MYQKNRDKIKNKMNIYRCLHLENDSVIENQRKEMKKILIKVKKKSE